jgi:tRNA threonylcarbamoyladenosine biosynthesis protein TsaB
MKQSMWTLALDTTTRAGSVALAREGTPIDEAAIDPSQPIATRLPTDLMTLLARHHVDLERIDLFAVATGPGSFTGLRIGIATMQGLALARGRPLIGISTFDALAHAEPSRRTATWIDAWRGEVYAALYEDGRETIPAVVALPAQVLAQLGPGATLFIGDGASSYRDLITSAVPGAQIADPPMPLLAGIIARLATTSAREGYRPPPHAVRPLYVRRPDAELARDRRG